MSGDLRSRAAGALGGHSSARSTGSATRSTTSSTLTGHYGRLRRSRSAGRSSACARCAIPILWERIEQRATATGRRWAWTDVRMDRLRELGIEPIVGLVHHGSGPLGTNLLDRRLRRRSGGVRPRRSPSGIRGSRGTRRSTSRSPRRASARCTASGIRTSATTRSSCARRSTRCAPRGSPCAPFARSRRALSSCRRRISAVPTRRRRYATRRCSRTSGDGSRSTCSLAG